ncbi:MAG TPA: hypothetical protein VE964_07535 [Myxococcales bacterium]|nr:hypothetical protein [Myxococcales bacterium]
MRALLAAALLLCACAHAKEKEESTVCPESRGQRCLTAQKCALDKQRGCEVCQCSPASGTGPDGKPTVNSN